MQHVTCNMFKTKTLSILTWQSKKFASINKCSHQLFENKNAESVVFKKFSNNKKLKNTPI